MVKKGVDVENNLKGRNVLEERNLKKGKGKGVWGGVSRMGRNKPIGEQVKTPAYLGSGSRKKHRVEGACWVKKGKETINRQELKIRDTK